MLVYFTYFYVGGGALGCVHVIRKCDTLVRRIQIYPVASHTSWYENLKKAEAVVDMGKMNASIKTKARQRFLLLVFIFPYPLKLRLLLYLYC